MSGAIVSSCCDRNPGWMRYGGIRTTTGSSGISAIRRNEHDQHLTLHPGLTEVMAAVKAQGIGPPGPWFTHHLKMNSAIFDFEICVPVNAPVAPVGRVKPGTFRDVTVARTVYHGAYEGLGEAWGEFKAWIATNRHAAGPDLYECYPVWPESSPNPADWRTELSQPSIALDAVRMNPDQGIGFRAS